MEIKGRPCRIGEKKISLYFFYMIINGFASCCSVWQSSPDGNYIENTFTIFLRHVLDDFPFLLTSYSLSLSGFLQFLYSYSLNESWCFHWELSLHSTPGMWWFIWIFLIYLCLHTACMHNGLNLTLFPGAFTWILSARSFFHLVRFFLLYHFMLPPLLVCLIRLWMYVCMYNEIIKR